MRRAAAAVGLVGLAAAGGGAWVLRAEHGWRPTVVEPRPSGCVEAAPAADAPFWVRTLEQQGDGQYEVALSADGCLRLREQRLWGRPRRWQVLQLSADGGEQVRLEAWLRRGAGDHRFDTTWLLRQAPGALPTQWRDSALEQARWFDLDGGVVVQRTWLPDTRQLRDERGGATTTVTLEPFDPDRHPLELQQRLQQHPDY